MIELTTEAMRAMVERHAHEIDPELRPIGEWPEALAFQIDMARRVICETAEACAKKCDELQRNHDRYYRTAGHDGKPYDPAHCAVAIRAMLPSNAELTGGRESAS